jgi:hypothetical protein
VRKGKLVRRGHKARKVLLAQRAKKETRQRSMFVQFMATVR